MAIFSWLLNPSVILNLNLITYLDAKPDSVIWKTVWQQLMWTMVWIVSEPSTYVAHVSFECAHALTWLHTMVWILEILDLDVRDWTSNNCVLQTMYLILMVQLLLVPVGYEDDGSPKALDWI